MMCPSPIDAVVLADYWLGALPSAEEEAVELHLLECDRCGDRFREVIALSEGLRVLAQSGALRVVVDDEFIRHAETVGRRVRQYSFAPGETVACTVSADDDMLVAHLAADVSSAARLDLSLCDPAGVERQRLSDIQVRRDAGSVVYHESIAFAKGSPTTSMIARLLAVDTDGAERVLGEYTFHHTRTILGPPAWNYE